MKGINYTLSKKIRKKLLSLFLFEACKHYKIPFCLCVEQVFFQKMKPLIVC